MCIWIFKSSRGWGDTPQFLPDLPTTSNKPSHVEQELFHLAELQAATLQPTTQLQLDLFLYQGLHKITKNTELPGHIHGRAG